MITNVPLQTIILNLEEQITRASNQFSHWEDFREQAYEPSWVIEATFLQLLAALEYLGMPELRNAGYLEYKELATKRGFRKLKRIKMVNHIQSCSVELVVIWQH